MEKKEWCIPKITDEFINRMNNLLELYQKPYHPKEPIVCVDEKTKQLLEHLQEPLPLRAKQGIREDYHYKRKGTCNIFLAIEGKAGKRFTQVTARKTKEDYAQFFVATIETQYPEATKVHWVTDNFQTHTEKCLRKVLGDHPIFNKVEFHFTPVHGSWLNQAELEIGILSRQNIAGRIPSKDVLEKYVKAWEKERNEREVKLIWKFTKEKAAEKFKLTKYQ